MEIETFYDELTPYYHLIYENWEESIQKQAYQLDAVIQERWGNKIHEIYDVSCGIGTQTLGLAQKGYRMSASDISEQEIKRAQEEALKRNLNIDFFKCDMKSAFDHRKKEYDCVVSCDNAIPHLQTDSEIEIALSQFYKCARQGGGCLFSVRDYEKENLSAKVFKSYGMREEKQFTYQISQIWDCEDTHYTVSMYIIRDDGKNDRSTLVTRSKYYAISIGKLMDLMSKAGFENVQRLDGKYFQPIIIGDKN